MSKFLWVHLGMLLCVLAPASALQGQDPKIRLTVNNGPSGISCLQFAPDGKTLAAQSRVPRRWELKIWDVTTQKNIGKHAAAGVITFRPDGSAIAIGGVNSRIILLMDLKTGKSQRIGVINALATGFKDPSRLDHNILSLDFSPDGKTLAWGGLESTVRLLAVEKGGISAGLIGESARIGALRFSPDGKILASGNFDDKIDLWDVDSRKIITTLKGHSDHVSALAFRPDGKVLASGSDDKSIMLWDVSAGKSIATLKGHTDAVQYVAISADGKTVVSGSKDLTVRLWDIASGKNTSTLKGTRGRPALSPDGKTLATGNAQGEIQLWDMPTASDAK